MNALRFIKDIHCENFKTEIRSQLDLSRRPKSAIFGGTVCFRKRVSDNQDNVSNDFSQLK